MLFHYVKNTDDIQLIMLKYRSINDRKRCFKRTGVVLQHLLYRTKSRKLEFYKTKSTNTQW